MKLKKSCKECSHRNIMCCHNCIEGQYKDSYDTLYNIYRK